jgi:hypothetical protein
VWTGCDDDDVATPDVGNPVIHYVRTTDPTTSDSLLTGAFMGSLIAIVGDDLAATRELWFNDQRSTLNPTYVTDNTILASVPSTVPVEVNNKMRLVFADGSELLYDFSVNVPGPVLTGIKSEYVPDGEIAVLYGDFYFSPITVTFPEGLEAEIVTLEKTRLEVRVPAGATTGQVSIRTNFGTVKSSFLFRDNRNIILDYDTKLHETWTAPIAMTGNNPDPAPVAGNYAFFKNDNFGAWVWDNPTTMQYWAPRGRGNIPVAVGSKNDLVFKFEVNIPVEWVEVPMRIFFGPYAEDHGHDGATHFHWKPWENGPYKTDGWQTVSIPLTEFNIDKDGNPKELGDLSGLTNVTMMLFGPADAPHPVYIAFDNIRIVPK